MPTPGLNGNSNGKGGMSRYFIDMYIYIYVHYDKWLYIGRVVCNLCLNESRGNLKRCVNIFKIHNDIVNMTYILQYRCLIDVALLAHPINLHRNAQLVLRKLHTTFSVHTLMQLTVTILNTLQFIHPRPAPIYIYNL